jgi:hypothetical protein
MLGLVSINIGLFWISSQFGLSLTFVQFHVVLGFGCFGFKSGKISSHLILITQILGRMGSNRNPDDLSLKLNLTQLKLT